MIIEVFTPLNNCNLHNRPILVMNLTDDGTFFYIKQGVTNICPRENHLVRKKWHHGTHMIAFSPYQLLYWMKFIHQKVDHIQFLTRWYLYTSGSTAELFLRKYWINNLYHREMTTVDKEGYSSITSGHNTNLL